ncbi:MAG: phosphate regulon sensor histidine kinase PhoR [Burkholderiaceae bacterium]|jgi:two-component system phosphate regulon sensor histidine kinase PhoR|nr:phosphate regulon sensor histidine kinase PhoR [Burkholderiaceae bacterium]
MPREIQRRIRVILPAVMRLVAIAAAAALSGAWLGVEAGLWVALIAIGLLFTVHLHYLSTLGAWLERPSLETIPEGWGSWSEVFNRLHKSRRASEISARRLEENEARFRQMIDALPEGIVLVDAALQIEWCNAVAERHLSIRLAADRGMRITNLVRDPAFVGYVAAASFDQPLLLRPLANPALALSVRVIEFEPARSIIMSRDVTEAERLDAMRRDFVANVSHELRTPLTVVNGFLETLLDAEPPLDEVRQRHLRLMHEQASRMSRLVEDLLMLARLEAGETPPAEDDVDVPALVAELEAEARALSGGRHEISRSAEPIRVRGSRDELRSAFGNLVSNAIRYTPSGGRIDLLWRAADGGAEFEVRDSGIGIAAEHLPRLTERFYRVDRSRSRETGGTGLGLAIVKHVLVRHQGRLQVDSEEGRGSSFRAWLPQARLETGAAPLARAA